MGSLVEIALTDGIGPADASPGRKINKIVI
jgi:hypothetical protein